VTQRHGRAGLHDPVGFFEGLRPARRACVEQLRNLRPTSPEYHMMFVVIAAMDVAAEFFTRQRSFYTVGAGVVARPGRTDA
jgi:hypothetical protein